MHRPAGAMAAAGLAVLAGGALTSCGPPSATPTARAYLAAWARGDFRAAAGQTDNAPAATQSLTANADHLGVQRIRLDLGSVRTHGSTTTATFVAHVAVPALATWTYDGSLRLVRHGGRWRVHWDPTDIHPALTAKTHLGVIRSLPPRAPLLDDHGTPLFKPLPVVRIGIEPARLRGHADTTIATVARAVGLHDVAGLRAAVRRAPPHQFVPVITLRKAAYEKVKPRIYSLPGTVFLADTQLLPPATGFGQALLGTVGPATADVLQRAGADYRSGDVLGLSGLQAAFQRRLAGSAGGRIAVEDVLGTSLQTLATFAPHPGSAVRTTIDTRTQLAAESALAHEPRAAALVAVKASTGEVLAVANTPDTTSYDRALEGHYPPGSTFKVVTTYALLGRGVTPATPVPCPPKIDVGGRTFRNFEGETSAGAVFATDFAISCNTAFIAASQRLGSRDLSVAAQALGLQGTWQLPLPSFSGAVPPTTDKVTLAADAIGQGTVSVSPLGMAMVAAAVARGAAHLPTLVTDPAQQFASVEGARLDPARLRTLRILMRSVVTHGTAAAAGLPAGTYGKTGTAEFGTTNPPQTHAWFIGWHGDVAFAVLVEGGGVGGRVAAPIAARFLRALG